MDAQVFEEDKNFAWWSTCNTRYPGHLVLPNLVESLASPGTGFLTHIQDFIGNIYIKVCGNVYLKSNDCCFSSSKLASSGGGSSPGASMAFMLGSTQYMVLATDTGYDWTANGCCWCASTTNIATQVFFDCRWWGLDRLQTVPANLISSTILGTEVAQGAFRTSRGTNTVDKMPMVVGRDAAGNNVIYLIHNSGLYVYDVDNERFEPTELRLQPGPNQEVVIDWWLGRLYVGNQNELFEYIPGNPANVRLIGLNPRDGLPELYRANLFWVTHGPFELYVMTRVGLASGTADERAAVLGWDRKGWRVLWTGPTNEAGQTSMLVSGADENELRLFWASDPGSGTLYWTTIPSGTIHPNQITEQTYAPSSTHETPRFNVADDVVGNLLSLKVRHTNCTSTIHITCFYRINESASWVQLLDAQAGSVNFDATDDRIEGSDGITEFIFPNRTDPVGLAFRDVQFRFDFATGTNTISPDIRSVTFEYEKTLPLKWAHRITIAVKDNLNEFSAEQLLDNIRTAVDSDTLVEFTFRNRDDDLYNYWVRILNISGMEHTGDNFDQEIELLLVEP